MSSLLCVAVVVSNVMRLLPFVPRVLAVPSFSLLFSTFRIFVVRFLQLPFCESKKKKKKGLVDLTVESGSNSVEIVGLGSC
jgi:hypothetical protein